MSSLEVIEILYQSSIAENIAQANISGNAAIRIVMGAAFSLVGLFMGLKAIIKRQDAAFSLSVSPRSR